MNRSIKFLVLDVDGTLTDGRIYMGEKGELLKAFNIKDGCGIKDILPECGIVPVVITARKSPMVINRCAELGVTEVHQGVRDKLSCLSSIIERYNKDGGNYALSNVAYMGDDILDLKCMNPIKRAGGILGCPSDAVKEILSVSDFVAPHKGGEGAVRDFIEFLLEQTWSIPMNSAEVEIRCKEAIDYLVGLHDDALAPGVHNVNESFYYSIQEYMPDGDKDKPYESHRKYIDVQLLLGGEEMLQVTDINRLTVVSPYDEKKDRTLYHASDNGSGTILRPGSVVILYPKDAHRSIRIRAFSGPVKKIVGKLLI